MVLSRVAACRLPTTVVDQAAAQVSKPWRARTGRAAERASLRGAQVRTPPVQCHDVVALQLAAAGIIVACFMTEAIKMLVRSYG